jgi:serine/threonine protein kinase
MNEIFSQYSLPIGTMVQEYRIIEILGIGNFGIVYRAENKYFSEIVALKEFLPSDLARRSEGELSVHALSSETDKAYQWARHKFLQEAKTLRELGAPDQHPNIVRVIQFIEAYDTAYMVMDFEQGQPLSAILKERGPLIEQEIRGILDALMDGLKRVHGASVWHRDIKPSNILIRPDGSPVLIDFGAARKDISGTDRSTMAIFSPAFAAPEQIYPVGDQGPWTDIYSLGATLYRTVTGKLPINAAKRMQDNAYVSVAKEVRGHYSPSFLAAIDAALQFYPKDRPQSIIAWKELFALKAMVMDDRTVLRPMPKQVPKIRKAASHRFFALIAAAAAVVAGLLIYMLTDWSKDTISTNEPPVAETEQIGPPDNESYKIGTDEPSTADINVFPVQARININSSPAAAQVYLNGELQGTTPLGASVSAGAHSLRLSLADHYDWESTLLIEQEGDIQLQISLLNK